MDKATAGDSISVTILRGRKQMTIKLILGEARSTKLLEHVSKKNILRHTMPQLTRTRNSRAQAKILKVARRGEPCPWVQLFWFCCSLRLNCGCTRGLVTHCNKLG